MSLKNLTINTTPVQSSHQSVDYLRNQNLEQILEQSTGVEIGDNEKLEARGPFEPTLVDLCRLNRCLLEHERTTILAFGTGWSTSVIADALSKLKLKYLEKEKCLQRNNLSELHVVGDQSELIRISRSPIPEYLTGLVTFHESLAFMSIFTETLSTYYEAVPDVSPVLIYVNGLNDFTVKSNVAGWSTPSQKDMMSMSSDFLCIEHFLISGTLIIFHVPTANSRFWGTNTQRCWSYQYDVYYDQYVVLLDEEPLENLNRKQLPFDHTQSEGGDCNA